jgi:hypothetical protein
MQIYVHRNNQQLGPFTEADIKAQLAAGTISLQDHVWWQGQASWLPLGQTPLGTPSVPPVPGIAPAMPEMAHPIGVPFQPVTAQTSQLAIWSLVCACLTFICGIALIPALILGHMSLGEIRRRPGMRGRGLAITALAISYIMLAIAILVVSAIVFLGSLHNNVQDMFKTITSQLNAAQAGNSSNSSDDSTTNTDQTTNAPDQSTNAADQSTNTPTATPATNSADQSTNSPTATPSSQ